MSENFILKGLVDPALCDEIHAFFKNHPTIQEGVINTVDIGVHVDKKAKISRDSVLNFNEDLTVRYVNELQKVVEEYIKKYPFCDYYSAWRIVEGINVQFYPPAGGYFRWHTERNGIGYGAHRHLVFMTYLNDVTDAGETEFFHQNLKVKPEKGLTLIWPADWTHTHRGIASPTQEKAIVTGWFEFTK